MSNDPKFRPMDRNQINHFIRAEIDRILDEEPSEDVSLGVIESVVFTITNTWIRDVTNNINEEVREQQRWNVAGNQGVY